EWELVWHCRRAYFRFGRNLARGARARHAVRTARHQERDGWAAACASRLSRRRFFFFMPPTERLLPPAGLVDPSLPLRPTRVHGVGVALEAAVPLREPRVPLIESHFRSSDRRSDTFAS